MISMGISLIQDIFLHFTWTPRLIHSQGYLYRIPGILLQKSTSEKTLCVETWMSNCRERLEALLKQQDKKRSPNRACQQFCACLSWLFNGRAVCAPILPFQQGSSTSKNVRVALRWETGQPMGIDFWQQPKVDVQRKSIRNWMSVLSSFLDEIFPALAKKIAAGWQSCLFLVLLGTR